jgi:hypothetical protein
MFSRHVDTDSHVATLDDSVPQMPSMLHEILLQLFRNRPELAPELLREALHVTLPPYSEARIESADLTDVQPHRVPR